MRATHMPMWKNCRCPWPRLAGVSKECTEASAPQSNEWSNLEGSKTSWNSCSQRARRTHSCKIAKDRMEQLWSPGQKVNLYPGTWRCQTHTRTHTYMTQPYKQEPQPIEQAINKCAKHRTLENSHIFFPVSIERGDSWNESSIELVQETGKRITFVTEDSRETSILFQRLSLALQRGNVVSFLGTLPTVATPLIT